MIIVTGGAGFIGSNIVKALNECGKTDILVVDDLKDGHKFLNLVDCDIADYMDRDLFLEKITDQATEFGYIEAIFHQGACSDTTEWDGVYMMKYNYEYSKTLLHFALERKIPFIYASSAATYGNRTEFKEELEFEEPLNVYGYSKYLFDQYVRRILENCDCQIAGCRYFNVYGPREDHKGRMASVAKHLNDQLLKNNHIKLFGGYDGYGDGEQRRDFIYVGDVVAINLWLFDHPEVSGIFNVGTGRSQTFNDVAKAVLAWHQKGKLDYIPFPDDLKGAYQSFTEADLSKLRTAGCDLTFKTVEEGVKAYLDWLNR